MPLTDDSADLQSEEDVESLGVLATNPRRLKDATLQEGAPTRSITAPGDCSCCGDGCCPLFDCDPICLTFDNLVLKNGGGTTLYTHPDPITLTFYFDSTAGQLYEYPNTHRSIVLTPDGTTTIKIATSIVPVCYQQTNGQPFVSFGIAALYNDTASPGFFCLAGWSIQLGSDDCDLTDLEASGSISQTPDPTNGGLAFDYDISLGACGDPDEECLTNDCLGSGGQPTPCCANGTSWYCNDGVTWTETDIPVSLTATVTTSTCGALPLASSFPLFLGVFNVINYIVPTWIVNQTTLTCEGDLYFMPSLSFVSLVHEPIKVAELTTIHSCDPVDIEVTFIANTSSLYSGCAGTVVRITE